jgi:hypothetical protein
MITYPLAHPARPYFRTCQIKLAEAVAFTENPFNLSRQYQRHEGQLWGVSAELPPMRRADGQRWAAFMLALRGGSGTFTLQYPEFAPLGSATGTPRLSRNHTVGVEELDTDGWTPNTSGILLAGDVIQIGSGATAGLYQVLQDANSDAGGLATLDIAPRLRMAWSEDTGLVTVGAQGVFRLAGSVASYDIDDMRMYGLQLDAIEALPA